jgi:hypothetical protein
MNTNGAAIKLNRQAAGYYTGTVAGRKVEVEYTQTNYGDKGWMVLLDDECITDYPRETKREAIELLRRQVAI